MKWVTGRESAHKIPMLHSKQRTMLFTKLYLGRIPLVCDGLLTGFAVSSST